MEVYSIDVDNNILVAGFGREIGIWNLKTMKNEYRAKFAHSDQISSVKLRDNYLISGGEDNIINYFDITEGLTMDSVMLTSNIDQSILKVDYFGNSLDYVQTSTTVHTYNVVNMLTSTSLYVYDAKDVNIYIFYV